MRTRTLLTALVLLAGSLPVLLGAEPARGSLAGASALLTRAPYLTDLTQSSVQVNWATSTQTRGVVEYGPLGACTAQAVASPKLGLPRTIGTTKEYLNSVTVSGLEAATSYCYRVSDTSTPPDDLLGTNPSPQFTTLEAPGASGPITFDVLGDWGDTTNSGVNNGSLNANQAGIDAGIAASGAQFAVSVGDLGYPGGTQTEYGDLNQTGINTSAVFGPSYWAVPGESIPLFSVSGNHGENVTEIDNLPENATAASSGGVYSMVSYPSIDGTQPHAYPTTYYAFSSGDVRFYMLDAAWGNANTGTATGGSCGKNCAIYEVDHDAKWTVSSAEYQWLARDLAAHPGGIKLAFLHFPFHSDNATQSSDNYLATTPGSSDSLEQLLQKGGVQLAFAGHAHIYERNVAPPGGVTSYVTGGGGAMAEPVGPCSTSDAYAVGWSYSSEKGSACGAAPKPTSDSQVFNFLKITVQAGSVTVTPTDAAGQTFDVQTYDLGPDTTAPSQPGNLTATTSTSGVLLSWVQATDNVGVSAYDVYRDGLYLATLGPGATSYRDKSAQAGTGYSYRVVARDLAGNSSSASVTSTGQLDWTPPPVPGGLVASATGYTTASLSWTGVSDPSGIYGYQILRDGAPVALVPAASTSYEDTELMPGTTYSYEVAAIDWAGNESTPTPAVSVTTTADTSPPSVPGTPVLTSIDTSSVGLSWSPATDNVGVVDYEVIRNGSVVATVAGTSYLDSSVSPSNTYSYQVAAFDAAGNSTPSGTLVATTGSSTPGSVFYDGFETGDLSRWTTVNGPISVESSTVHAGEFAAEEASTGAASYAFEALPSSYSELWASVWVDKLSASSSVNLFGFRGSNGGSIVNLYLNPSGKLALRNNVGKVTTTSSTYLPNGTWHQLVLHAFVNGTSSSLDVSLDGAPVAGLTLSGQNLGTNPITSFQLGETATGRTYDVCLDDVSLTSVAP